MCFLGHLKAKLRIGERRCRESDATIKMNIIIPTCIILAQDVIQITEELGENLLNLCYELTIQIYYTMEANVYGWLCIFLHTVLILIPVFLPKKPVEHLAKHG